MSRFLSEIVADAEVLGFSGTRDKKQMPIEAMDLVCEYVYAKQIIVGCQRGVDEFFRDRFPDAKIFAVSSGDFGVGKSAFARRSTACVREVAAAGNLGLWISFPSSDFPLELSPSRSWSSGKTSSGTWKSLALAVGLGVPSLVYTGSLRSPDWGLVEVAPGWFYFQPQPQQMSLF